MMPSRSGLPKRRSLAETVVDELASRIRNGTYQPGEKLPTEPKIMAELGVSRTVVREAVSRLQAAGLAETRHGVGTFVLLTPGTRPLDIGMVVTIKDVLAMLEIRISLETEAAALAAVRRSDLHLAGMQQAIEDFEIDVAAGGDGVACDVRFHGQIAEATGNHYFEKVFRSLGPGAIPRTRLDTTRLDFEQRPTYLRRADREHRAVCDAIARRDVDAARAAMRMHLTNSRERLRAAGGIDDETIAR